MHNKSPVLPFFLKLDIHHSGSSSTLNKIAPPGSGFSNNFIAFGAEGYFRANKIVVALDANMGLQKMKPTCIERAAVSSGVAYARLGWIMAEKKHYWIYPSIGPGIAAVDINTYVNDEASNLKNKLHYSPSFDMGFNADFIMRKIPDKEDFGTMLIGLKTGYRVSIRNKGWRDNNNNKLSNMPSNGQNEFYIMVTIGSGVFVREQIRKISPCLYVANYEIRQAGYTPNNRC
jgi:hypothetical protein